MHSEGLAELDGAHAGRDELLGEFDDVITENLLTTYIEK